MKVTAIVWSSESQPVLTFEKAVEGEQQARDLWGAFKEIFTEGVIIDVTNQVTDANVTHKDDCFHIVVNTKKRIFS
jgi:hypothetical protein